jgi:hypothetical protein
MEGRISICCPLGTLDIEKIFKIGGCVNGMGLWTVRTLSPF